MGRLFNDCARFHIVEWIWGYEGRSKDLLIKRVDTDESLPLCACCRITVLWRSFTGGPGECSWYTGGIVTSGPFFSSYQAAENALIAAAPSAPGNNTWTITNWNSGSMPTGTFNVLVTASPEGSWSTNPNFSALATAASGIRLGDRVMLTGQDADYHLINGPGDTNFNGPKGFLLNAINWASSGTGMGAVFLGGYSQTGFVFTGQTETVGNQNSVIIPGAVASFPINTNLTSAGLSNWGISAHDTYTIQDTTKWTGINVSGTSTTNFVTIVSAATGGGGITPPASVVPEPATVGLMAMGLVGLVFSVRKRRAV